MLDLVKSAAVVVCKDRVWKQAKHKGVKQWEYLKNIPRFILNYPNRMTSSAATQLFCSPNPASSTLFSLLTHWALSCSCSLRFILAHSGKKSHFSLFCWGCMANGFTINESTGRVFVCEPESNSLLRMTIENKKLQERSLSNWTVKRFQVLHSCKVCAQHTDQTDFHIMNGANPCKHP